MNIQTKNALVILAVIILWSSGTCTPITQTSAPTLEPTVPPAAALLSPSGSIGSLNNPTYTWKKVQDASRYFLWVKGPSGIVFRKWYEASSVCRDRVCSATPPLLLSRGKHTWRIRTKNDAGYGPWSTSLGFTISKGAILYVSPKGNDSNPGTKTKPWRTIQKAANTATAGSTVIVQAGTYDERVTINKSGTKMAQIIFQTQGMVVMQGFTVRANYITIRGFEITNTPDDPRDGFGIWLRGGNCLIENNYIHYATRGGILLFAQPGSESLTANCVVRNNRLYQNSQFGIEVRGRNHLIEGNEIWGTIQHHPSMTVQPSWADADGIHFFGSGHVLRKNYIHDIQYGIPENVDPHIDCFQTWGDSTYHEAASNIVIERNRCVNAQAQSILETGKGLMLQDANNLTIRNNIINAYVGIMANNRSNNLIILNNTIIGNVTQTIAYFPCGVSLTDVLNAIIQNNIFYDLPGHIINLNNVFGLNAQRNLAYRSDGKPLWTTGTYSNVNDFWGVNPLFVSTTDYHLQAGSPAVDAGLIVSLDNDFEGRPRPQGLGYDIGAFEWTH